MLKLLYDICFNFSETSVDAHKDISRWTSGAVIICEPKIGIICNVNKVFCVIERLGVKLHFSIYPDILLNVTQSDLKPVSKSSHLSFSTVLAWLPASTDFAASELDDTVYYILQPAEIDLTSYGFHIVHGRSNVQVVNST